MRKIVESFFVSATNTCMTGNVSDNDEKEAKAEAERIASELHGKIVQRDFNDLKQYFKNLKKEDFLTAFEVETTSGVNALVVCYSL